MGKVKLLKLEKTRICNYYACSNGEDKQYPECKGVRPKRCKLEEIEDLIEYIKSGNKL